MKETIINKLNDFASIAALLSITIVCIGASVGIFANLAFTWLSCTLCGLLWFGYAVGLAIVVAYSNEVKEAA